jgi:Rap1a immunity proteins
MYKLLFATICFCTLATAAIGADVATFQSRCGPLLEVAKGKRNPTVDDQKNLSWCAGHVSGILDGYRLGLLVKGDLDFAKTKAICPPENTTDVGLIGVVLSELEAHQVPPSTTLATAMAAMLSVKWPCR